MNEELMSSVKLLNLYHLIFSNMNLIKEFSFYF